MSFVQDLDPKDFLFQVNANFREGYKQIRKYGANTDVASVATPQFVWDGQFTYNYPTANETIYIVSSDASDTVEITIEGLVELNGDWIEQELTATLNGTTAVQVGDFIRVTRMRASNSISPIGIVQARTDTTYLAVTSEASVLNLRGQISLNPKTLLSRNSSLMSMYTVPSNKTAFMYRGFTGTRKNKDAEFDFEIRMFNKVFFTAEVITSYQISSQFELGYEKIKEKSDIRVGVTTENNNTETYASFHIVLVDNDKLPS